MTSIEPQIWEFAIYDDDRLYFIATSEQNAKDNLRKMCIRFCNREEMDTTMKNSLDYMIYTKYDKCLYDADGNWDNDTNMVVDRFLSFGECKPVGQLVLHTF